ncbi:hypothetical protein DQ04_03471020 [Trypanosoma grayi]|uniref:hypothetical protein n=1 Tax=Trypanosoma grayi TaxID=71804 RepID=UPI0004F4476A|nr:hypothetical protein DQ04_03471020 [Trypanosoma grayi]KEG10642.1 hypothetical protein DQ04_03471020 [Trypanosoma grayi]
MTSILLSVPEAHTEVVTSLQFSPHHDSIFCSTSGDDTAALWDLRQAGGDPEIARLTHHQGPVNHALFMLEDEYALFTASDDRTIARWDLRELRAPVGTICGFGDGINKMLRIPAPEDNTNNYTSSGSGRWLLASACDDGMVYIHSLGPENPPQQQGVVGATPAAALPSAGTMVDRFWAATSTVNDLALSPNPRMLLTASEDCAVRLWNIVADSRATTEHRLVASFEEFDNPVNHIAVVCTDAGAGQGQSSFWLYAACSEFVFAVDLDPATSAFGEAARTFTGHQDYVRGLEFVGGDTLLTVSDDATAIEWSLRTTEPVRQVKLHEGLVMASATSTARDVLVTGTDGGEIRAWQLPFKTETCCGGTNMR